MYYINLQKEIKIKNEPILVSNERRLLQGTNDNLVKEILIEDREKYVDYFRMPPQLFKALVGSVITKEYVVRKPISVNL